MKKIDFAFILLISILTYPLRSQQISIQSSDNYPLKIEGTTSTRISFHKQGTYLGYLGSILGEADDMDFSTAFLNTSGKLHLSIRSEPRLTVGNNGFIGIDTTNPTEKLTLADGNLLLKNSDKGIILDGQDAPMITRGWDSFTSGPYAGVGRWGLFMEPNRLVLGLPDLPEKGIEFARFTPVSNRNTLMTIHQSGKVTRPNQGNADLLPIALGNISADGTINGGTGNFTLAKKSTGQWKLDLLTSPGPKDAYILNATIAESGAVCLISVIQTGAASFLIVTNDLDGTYLDQGFHFLVFQGAK